jgi:hypothetical protein
MAFFHGLERTENDMLDKIANNLKQKQYISKDVDESKQTLWAPNLNIGFSN